MRVEDRPEHQAQTEPPTKDDWEMSFAGTLTNAVDTLFTYKPIVEKLQGLEEDEDTQAFVRRWKQALGLHLEETAWLAVENFLTDFEHFQAQTPANVSPTLPPAFSEMEPQPGADIEKLHQSFPIAGVCRVDLQGILTDEELAGLSDTDMQRIADKMSEAYTASGDYWNSLETVVRSVIKRKTAEETRS